MMERIIWLTGMPRSGTTWISQIFASSPDVRVKFCPLFSYRFKNALNEDSTPQEWEELFSRVYATPDEFMDQGHLRKGGLVPEFACKSSEPKVLMIKSNRFHNLTEGILQKCPGVRFISIIRDPRAAINSWLSNPLEFPAGQDSKTQWRSGACRKTGPGEYWGFSDWKWVATLHLRLSAEWPDRFIICRYEDFLLSPLDRTRELFDRLALPLTAQTRDFILRSQSRQVDHRRSVYRAPAKLDDWRTSLDPEIATTIVEEVRGTELAIFLES